MKCKKVINLFAGLGVGKSTISSGLYYLMKMNGFNVEMTGEFAKDLTYEKSNKILQTDQLYVLAQQNRRIQRLINEVDYIISDSPLILSLQYYNNDSNIYSENLFKLFAVDTFNKYPNMNFFLRRNINQKYQNFGRNQSYEEALNVDKKIKMSLDFFNIPYTEIDVNGEQTVLEILKILGEQINE